MSRRQRYHHKQRRRAVAYLAPILLLCKPAHLHASSTNFCGTDWNDASADCANRQPCPEGTDDECDSGVCWADTMCDTAKGDGILFDKENPQHQRFCGNSWNDASENCSIERHCPSGDDTECSDGEACYSFLSGCNYVEMMTGAGAAGGDEEEEGEPSRLDGDSPMRSNWCGSDWNDAIAHCTDDSHWCPSGSDSDCPAGKICFAGTDCKYVADLHPTETPTPAPSISPTANPIVYNTVENTRFCGSGWEDVAKNCQISRHCPGGKNTECGPGMTCFSWMIGCNIIDMREYLEAYGKEIYGQDRLEMDPVSLDQSNNSTETGSAGNNTSDSTTSDFVPIESTDNSTSGGPPPSLSLTSWTSHPSEKIITPPPMWTPPPVPPTPTASPAVEDLANKFYPEHHVFCGETWQEAQDNCSEETFCTDGAATHVCEKEGDYCWVGITACDAGDWLLADSGGNSSVAVNETSVPVSGNFSSAPISGNASSAPMAVSSSAPIDSIFAVPTLPPEYLLEGPSTDLAPMIYDNATMALSDEDRFSVRQSFCAENYIQLIDQCSSLETCNDDIPCPDGLECFKNVLCSSTEDTGTGSITNNSVGTPSPSIIIEAPTPAEPVTPLPSPALNVDTSFPVASKLISDSPVLVLLLTSTDSPSESLIVTPPPVAISPSQQPSMFTISAEEAAQRMSNPNNYCAKSLDEILAGCSYSLKTCNDGDPMCPLGTNCFGNVMCPGPTSAPITQPPIFVPVIVTTLEPTKAPNQTVAVDSVAIDATPQSYCAASEDMVQSTCATGFTCNEGFGTCPVGLFCFENVVCEASLDQSIQTETIPSWSTETATTISATATPISSGFEGTGSVGNYCATSEDLLQEQCKNAVVCNDGFGTCPLDTFCYSNVVCEALQGQSAEATSLSEPTKSTRVPADGDGEECDELCLKPVSPEDCDYILSLGLNILPCMSIGTELDQVCAGTGQCGTSLELNNCNGNEDLYMRVDVSACIDSGIGSSGVAVSDAIQSVSTPATFFIESTPSMTLDSPEADALGAIATEAPEAPVDSTAASNVDSTTMEEEQPNNDIEYSWEDSPGNAPAENKAEIDGWWIKEEAGGAAFAKHMQFLTFAPACFMMVYMVLE